MALRGHPRISIERRREVRELADKMGYRPDAMLASLIAYRQDKKTHPISATLGWINRWPTAGDLRQHREFDAYWRGAQAAAEQQGYRLQEFYLPANISGSKLERTLRARNVQGVLLPPHPPAVTWSNFGLNWEELAVVRFGYSVADVKFHAVGNDQMRSAETAVEKIHALGYERIGFVTDHRFDEATDSNFRFGYLRSLEKMGLQIKPLLLDERTTTRRSVSALRRWLRETKPDAIFTSEPELPSALRLINRTLADKIGLAATAACDGGQIDAGLDQRPFEIGRVAVQLLIETIRHREFGIPSFHRRVMVEGCWLDGSSCPRASSTRPSR